MRLPRFWDRWTLWVVTNIDQGRYFNAYLSREIRWLVIVHASSITRVPARRAPNGWAMAEQEEA